MPHADRNAAEPMSIMLLARSLERGGAERQAVMLAKGLRERGHSVSIALFYRRGGLIDEVEDAGIEILDLKKKDRWDAARFLNRAVAVVRRANPDVIFSILGGANLVAAAIKPFAGRSRLVWSVRNSAFDLSVDHWLARVGQRFEAALSRVPDAIIANSEAGRAFAISRGFPEAEITVVPNGIDTDSFRRHIPLRIEQRRTLGLADDEIAVGMLARLNSTKDYPTFLRAAAMVAKGRRNVRFLCVGSGDDLHELERLAGDLGVRDRVAFTGDVDAVAALNAFDIFCSSSVTEGFSNAIAEAMACGLPCIVTDVGDSARLVGDTGTVVPPSSPEVLARAIEGQILALATHDPAKPRRRIVDNFSTGVMVERSLEVFRSVLEV